MFLGNIINEIFNKVKNYILHLKMEKFFREEKLLPSDSKHEKYAYGKLKARSHPRRDFTPPPISNHETKRAEKAHPFSDPDCIMVGDFFGGKSYHRAIDRCVAEAKRNSRDRKSRRDEKDSYVLAE